MTEHGAGWFRSLPFIQSIAQEYEGKELPSIGGLRERDVGVKLCAMLLL